VRRVVQRTIVDPPEGTWPAPLSRAELEDIELRGQAASPSKLETEKRAAPPADPFGFEAMTIAQLHEFGRTQSMPAAQRRELERTLNAKIKAQRAPRRISAEEHERAWRNHGGLH
jgi:hypothetical protein